MFTVIVFVAIGAALGVLSFPTFALIATACSVLYSVFNFNGTMPGLAADLLGVLAALQLGYFLTVVAIVLYHSGSRPRGDDQ